MTKKSLKLRSVVSYIFISTICTQFAAINQQWNDTARRRHCKHLLKVEVTISDSLHTYLWFISFICVHWYLYTKLYIFEHKLQLTFNFSDIMSLTWLYYISQIVQHPVLVWGTCKPAEGGKQQYFLFKCLATYIILHDTATKSKTSKREAT